MKQSKLRKMMTSRDTPENMNTDPDLSDYWQAVLDRDQSYEGLFVYGVKSTGIYCRPTCPSRRPHRDKVEFFTTGEEARAAGYRACMRCRPDEVQEQLQLVEAICDSLKSIENAPTLAQLSERFHFSPFHLQRVFKRVTGVSPRQYFDAQRVQRLKSALKGGDSVLDALYEAGYSSTSQIYGGELGMTPTEYQNGGAHSTLRYALLPSALGVLLIAATEHGLCAVRLGDDGETLIDELRTEYPRAALRVIAPDSESDPEFRRWVQVVYAVIQNEANDAQRYSALSALPLDIQATAFQRRVWEALRAIPVGDTRSYADIADAIGQPEAVRAVARAIATNPVAVVIPCHRVIRSDGQLSGYRWGTERKHKLLEREGALAHRVSDGQQRLF
jgi:AraC family transcriptional regulator of adaptative response/methylated-DNA-[protein]-cysteine methyltransferase